MLDALLLVLSAAPGMHLPSPACSTDTRADSVSCIEHIQKQLQQGSTLSMAAAGVSATYPACGGCSEASTLALARPCALVEMLSAAPTGGKSCGDLVGSVLIAHRDVHHHAESALPVAHRAVGDAYPLSCACEAAGDACGTLAGESTCRAREADLLIELGETISFADARRQVAAKYPHECGPCAVASELAPAGGGNVVLPDSPLRGGANDAAPGDPLLPPKLPATVPAQPTSAPSDGASAVARAGASADAPASAPFPSDPNRGPLPDAALHAARGDPPLPSTLRAAGPTQPASASSTGAPTKALSDASAGASASALFQSDTSAFLHLPAAEPSEWPYEWPMGMAMPLAHRTL